jgi:predicted MPP superfamily phosphohydrolase
VLVNGNTDDAEIVEDIAEETGATYLDDELVEFTVRGQVINVLGLSVSGDRDRRDIDADLLEQLRTTTRRQDLVIAVSHYPDPVLSLTPGTTIDLILSGHTHGGQVALPRLGPLVTASDVPRVVAAGGLHVVDGHPIYVSTGVGLERGQAPQLRFGVPPSVALITIVPA